MPENETGPMSMEDAIVASGGSVGPESSEQQATEETQTTEETASETQTQETSSETQEEGATEETTTEETTEETEAATTDEEIIDLETSETTEETTEETTSETSTETSPVKFGEILNGEFDSEEDLAGYLGQVHSEIDSLKKENEELKGANEPEFANEAIKKANEYVKNGGKAADFFRVQGVDVENMSPADKLVTHLKMNNPDLSDQKAREYIQEKYNLQDGENGSENTQMIIDAKQASDEIKKLQADDTPGKGSGLSEEEWNKKLEETTKAEEEALLKEDEARMDAWEKPIEDSIKNLQEKGIVVNLGNGKGYKYKVDADDKYFQNLTNQVEEALFMSGTSIQENPELARQMVEMQFKADNFDKILKAAMVKGANSANEAWFKEVHNPSAVQRGDKPSTQGEELPTAEEAFAKVIGQ